MRPLERNRLSCVLWTAILLASTLSCTSQADDLLAAREALFNKQESVFSLASATYRGSSSFRQYAKYLEAKHVVQQARAQLEPLEKAVCQAEGYAVEDQTLLLHNGSAPDKTYFGSLHTLTPCELEWYFQHLSSQVNQARQQLPSDPERDNTAALQSFYHLSNKANYVALLIQARLSYDNNSELAKEFESKLNNNEELRKWLWKRNIHQIQALLVYLRYDYDRTNILIPNEIDPTEIDTAYSQAWRELTLALIDRNQEHKPQIGASSSVFIQMSQTEWLDTIPKYPLGLRWSIWLELRSAKKKLEESGLFDGHLFSDAYISSARLHALGAIEVQDAKELAKEITETEAQKNRLKELTAVILLLQQYPPASDAPDWERTKYSESMALYKEQWFKYHEEIYGEDHVSEGEKTERFTLALQLQDEADEIWRQLMPNGPIEGATAGIIEDSEERKKLRTRRGQLRQVIDKLCDYEHWRYTKFSFFDKDTTLVQTAAGKARKLDYKATHFDIGPLHEPYDFIPYTKEYYPDIDDRLAEQMEENRQAIIREKNVLEFYLEFGLAVNLGESTDDRELRRLRVVRRNLPTDLFAQLYREALREHPILTKTTTVVVSFVLAAGGTVAASTGRLVSGALVARPLTGLLLGSLVGLGIDGIYQAAEAIDGNRSSYELDRGVHAMATGAILYPAFALGPKVMIGLMIYQTGNQLALNIKDKNAATASVDGLMLLTMVGTSFLSESTARTKLHSELIKDIERAGAGAVDAIHLSAEFLKELDRLAQTKGPHLSLAHIEKFVTESSYVSRLTGRQKINISRAIFLRLLRKQASTVHSVTEFLSRDELLHLGFDEKATVRAKELTDTQRRALDEYRATEQYIENVLTRATHESTSTKVVTTAAEVADVNNVNVIVGSAMESLDVALGVLDKLMRGDTNALAPVGIDSLPSHAQTFMREWAIAYVPKTRRFVLLKGDLHSCTVGFDITPVAHSHPSSWQRDITNKNKMRLGTLDPGIELAYPSSGDIVEIGVREIDSHFVYTPYKVSENGDVLYDANVPANARLVFEIKLPKYVFEEGVVGVWEAEVIARTGDQIRWKGKMRNDPASRTNPVHLVEPTK